jgi:type II secretory pathway pseudopilin PulG
MKLSNEAGFTIIETMLFLGITALLVVGVLVGTGNSINIQRYRDSVSSLQSVLQQQYSDVSNVNNDNPGNLACHGSTKARGQSDCSILGRFITTSKDGCFGIDNYCKLSIKMVLGFAPSTSTSSLNDIDIFGSSQGYGISVVDDMSDTYDLEWGSSIVDTHGAASVFSMLVLRSPISGTLRTFIDPNTPVVVDSNVQSLLTSDALTKEGINVCVNSNGLFTGSRSAVIVKPNTSDASGVETLGDKSGC